MVLAKKQAKNIPRSWTSEHEWIFPWKIFHLKKPDSNTNTSNHSNIVLNLGGELVQASWGVDLHAGLVLGRSEDILAAVVDGGEAAGVRNIDSSRECDIAPVPVLLSSAAVQLIMMINELIWDTFIINNCCNTSWPSNIWIRDLVIKQYLFKKLSYSDTRDPTG